MDKLSYFSSLNHIGDKDQRIIEMERYATTHQVPIIQEEGLAFLLHLINIVKPKRILEIGTAIGYTAIHMALVNEHIEVTTIERDPLMVSEARKNIASFSFGSRITLIEADALTYDIDRFDGMFDVLFIDGAKSQNRRFFEKYSKMLSKDGVIITDNLVFHDFIFKKDHEIANRNTRQLVRKIKEYNEWLSHHPEFKTFFYSLGDGMAVSIRREGEGSHA